MVIKSLKVIKKSAFDPEWPVPQTVTQPAVEPPKPAVSATTDDSMGTDEVADSFANFGTVLSTPASSSPMAAAPESDEMIVEEEVVAPKADPKKKKARVQK